MEIIHDSRVGCNYIYLLQKEKIPCIFDFIATYSEKRARTGLEPTFSGSKAWNVVLKHTIPYDTILFSLGTRYL